MWKYLCNVLSSDFIRLPSIKEIIGEFRRWIICSASHRTAPHPPTSSRMFSMGNEDHEVSHWKLMASESRSLASIATVLESRIYLWYLLCECTYSIFTLFAYYIIIMSLIWLNNVVLCYMQIIMNICVLSIL